MLRTVSGGLAPRVTQQVQSLVYQLNRKLQARLHRGEPPLRAADPARRRRELHRAQVRRCSASTAWSSSSTTLPQSERVATIRTFVRIARLALAQTGTALHATANPIELTQSKAKGRTWVLSAQVQSYGIALTVTFLALLLAAGAAAAEHDEGTIGRLRRGLVSLGQLVWSKVALAAVVGARARRGDRRRVRRRRRGRAA